jgi:soluble lytic murein transglycosylase
VAGLFFGYDFYLKKSYPVDFKEYVETCSERYKINKYLIFSVIKSESKFDKNAKSKAGAVGLMQIMPNTFKGLQNDRERDIIMDDSYLEEPDVSIDYGTYFLSKLLEKYNSEELALAAYNAGPAKIDEWLENKEYSDNSKVLSKIPYKETENYVKNVIKDKNIYQKLYK